MTDPNTKIDIESNGLPNLDTLFLAGEDGLNFLFQWAKSVAGPAFDELKVQFAKGLSDAATEATKSVETGVEGVVNSTIDSEIEKNAPVVAPVVEPPLHNAEKNIEDQVNAAVEAKLADLEKIISDKITSLGK